MNEKLGDELFRLVERDQGFAFISDGIGLLSEDKIFELARETIKLNNRVNRKIKRWLKNHGK